MDSLLALKPFLTKLKSRKSDQLVIFWIFRIELDSVSIWFFKFLAFGSLGLIFSAWPSVFLASTKEILAESGSESFRFSALFNDERASETKFWTWAFFLASARCFLISKK